MKRILIFLVFCFTGLALFAQSEELEAWSEAYDTAGTVVEQLVYIRNVQQGNYAGDETFYAKALARLVREYPNISVRSEWDAADASAQILTFELGEAKYADAAGDLWQTVEYFSNALVKAEALAALGKTGNTAYLPQVVQLMNDLNTRPQADREMRERSERIAYGAILALEYYKAPEGYLPVFFASTGWYSERIKKQASISFINIMEDPTEKLLEVVNNSGYTYDIKHLALRTSERSEASPENKARVAVASLTEGWRNRVTEPRQRTELTQMRKLALNMIGRYKTQDAAVYPQLDLSYRDGDMDEKLLVLTALKNLASEDSTRLLSGYLRTINLRRESDTLTTNDEQLVRVIIPALGDLGAVGRAARPALSQVQQSPKWSSAIQRLAADALRRIGN